MCADMSMKCQEGPLTEIILRCSDDDIETFTRETGNLTRDFK